MRSPATLLAAVVLLAVGALNPLPIRAAPEPDKPPDLAPANDRSIYQLASSVISAGGAPGVTSQHQLNGTVGQPAVIGMGGNDAYLFYAGFWYTITLADILTGADDPPSFVNQLDQNVPNPFNPQTVITFQVAQTEQVRLEVFDLAGRRVRTLVHELRPPGRHDVVWDGRDDHGRSLPSNLYLYRLQVGRFAATRKMLLLK